MTKNLAHFRTDCPLEFISTHVCVCRGRVCMLMHAHAQCHFYCFSQNPLHSLGFEIVNYDFTTKMLK